MLSKIAVIILVTILLKSINLFLKLRYRVEGKFGKFTAKCTYLAEMKLANLSILKIEIQEVAATAWL